MFDDGGGGPGCTPGTNGHPARGIIFHVGALQRAPRLRLLHAYVHHPALHPACCGSVQTLTGGDALIDWGKTGAVTQVAGDGALLMDLSLSNWSYRAARLAWVGQPLTRPAVAGRLTTAGTDVWASWNGSTQVAAWRVLAGEDPLHLSPVGVPHPRQGFETEVVLPDPYAYVAVQALGASGAVLSTSGAVETVTAAP